MANNYRRLDKINKEIPLFFRGISCVYKRTNQHLNVQQLNVIIVYVNKKIILQKSKD